MDRRSILKGLAATPFIATVVKIMPLVTPVEAGPAAYVKGVRAAGGDVTVHNGGVAIQYIDNQRPEDKAFWNRYTELRAEIDKLPDGMKQVREYLIAEQPKWQGDGWYSHREPMGTKSVWMIKKDPQADDLYRAWPFPVLPTAEAKHLTSDTVHDFIVEKVMQPRFAGT